MSEASASYVRSLLGDYPVVTFVRSRDASATRVSPQVRCVRSMAVPSETPDYSPYDSSIAQPDREGRISFQGRITADTIS